MVEAINNLNTNVPTVKNTAVLEAKFSDIKDKQGFLGSIWNGFKEITGTGLSKSDCESTLEKYKRGEISFDEALEIIESFDKKQDEMSDLGANILTGIGAIAAATVAASAGPIGWAFAFAKGAPIGAVLKTGIKVLDRASNNKKGDEFDTKQMAKDAISGAITGTTSAVASGVGAGIKAGKISLSIKNGTKCGAQCGALAGSASYRTDVTFDDDKYFNIGDLVKRTATSTFVSGTVGGFVGAGMYGLSNNVGQDVSKTVSQTIVADSTSSSSRKILGSAERTALAFNA